VCGPSAEWATLIRWTSRQEVATLSSDKVTTAYVVSEWDSYLYLPNRNVLNFLLQCGKDSPESRCYVDVLDLNLLGIMGIACIRY
jgi:hypothetical protein